MRTISLIAIATLAASLAATIPATSQPIPGFNRGPGQGGPGQGGPGGRPGGGGPGSVNREAELIGLRTLCDRGDRQACIRFGFMLGQAQEHHSEWRRSHADWWAWERR